MIEDNIRERIAKVYTLAEKGATQGERKAAKQALDRLMKKYNLNEEYVKSIKEKLYSFTYSMDIDKHLMSRLISFLIKKDDIKAYLDTNGKRAIVCKLEYLDYVTLECAYEYFRKHMRGEYKRLVTPQLNRCRSAKTKKARKQQLEDIFFSKYVIASKLYEEKEISHIEWSELSETERKQRASLDGVQGGSYRTQVTTGLYLE